MIIISSREFRDKLGKYLSLAKEGEDIVLKSRENGSFKLVPMTENERLSFLYYQNLLAYYSKIH